MKGVIVKALEEMIKDNYGEKKWKEILTTSGLPENIRFTLQQEVDDIKVMEVLKNTTKVLGITMEQATDAYGDYWVNVYAPKIYSVYFKGVDNAKDFLKKMDRVHEITTKSMPNAHPPRFKYEEPDEKTLIMTYQSQRGLVNVFIGLVKGVGKHFNENLKITKLDSKRVKIEFP